MHNIKIEDVVKNPENYFYRSSYIGDNCEILYAIHDTRNDELVLVYKFDDDGISCDDNVPLCDIFVKSTDDIGFGYEKKKWKCIDSSYEVLNVYYDMFEKKMFVVYKNIIDRAHGSWKYDFKTFLSHYIEVK